MDGIQLAWTPAVAAILSPVSLGACFNSTKLTAANSLQFTSTTNLNSFLHQGGTLAVAFGQEQADRDRDLSSVGDGTLGQGASSAEHQALPATAFTPWQWMSVARLHISTMIKSAARIRGALLMRTTALWMNAIGAVSGLLPVGLPAGRSGHWSLRRWRLQSRWDAREHLDGNLDISRLS